VVFAVGAGAVFFIAGADVITAAVDVGFFIATVSTVFMVVEGGKAFFVGAGMVFLVGASMVFLVGASMVFLVGASMVFLLVGAIFVAAAGVVFLEETS
jgi:hypothetical protein